VTPPRLPRPRTPKPQTRRPRLERLEGRDLPSAGGLDPTFGHGRLAAGPPPGTFQGFAGAVAPDGKVIVAGARHDPGGGRTGRPPGGAGPPSATAPPATTGWPSRSGPTAGSSWAGGRPSPTPSSWRGTTPTAARTRRSAPAALRRARWSATSAWPSTRRPCSC